MQSRHLIVAPPPPVLSPVSLRKTMSIIFSTGYKPSAIRHTHPSLFTPANFSPHHPLYLLSSSRPPHTRLTIFTDIPPPMLPPSETAASILKYARQEKQSSHRGTMQDAPRFWIPRKGWVERYGPGEWSYASASLRILDFNFCC